MKEKKIKTKEEIKEYLNSYLIDHNPDIEEEMWIYRAVRDFVSSKTSLNLSTLASELAGYLHNERYEVRFGMGDAFWYLHVLGGSSPKKAYLSLSLPTSGYVHDGICNKDGITHLVSMIEYYLSKLKNLSVLAKALQNLDETYPSYVAYIEALNATSLAEKEFKKNFNEFGTFKKWLVK